MSITPSFTEERILDAARRVLAAHPGATMDEIAGEARVGRATVFRCFRNRAELLKTLAGRAIAVTDQVASEAAASAETATEALRRVITAVLGASDHYRFLGAAAELSGEEEIASAYERQLGDLAELVAAARREGSIRPELPTGWVVAMIDGQIWAAGAAVTKGAVGRLQAQELLWESIVDGIGTDSVREEARAG